MTRRICRHRVIERKTDQAVTLRGQVENWDLTPADVQPITYDNSGNIYRGF